MESHKYLRLALVYVFWAAAVIVALLFARAYDLDSYNIGWGDITADRGHAVLGQETAAAVIVCCGLAILVGILSRLALYSIVAVGAMFWLLGVLGAHGPHFWRALLFIPQLPGIYAGIIALGVHNSSEGLFGWWVVGVNTVLYAPVLFTFLARRKQRQWAQLQAR